MAASQPIERCCAVTDISLVTKFGSAARTTPSNPPQQPREQGGPNGRKFGNGSFCGIHSAVRLGLELPSISRRRRRFFGGFRLGVAQPGAAQRRRGGAQGGIHPLRPSEFCAVAGRERAFGPIRRAKWAKIGALWAAGGTARSRQDEPIERRPEEQGTQDAETPNEGMRISAAMAIAPPSI